MRYFFYKKKDSKTEILFRIGKEEMIYSVQYLRREIGAESKWEEIKFTFDLSIESQRIQYHNLTKGVTFLNRQRWIAAESAYHHQTKNSPENGESRDDIISRIKKGQTD